MQHVRAVTVTSQDSTWHCAINITKLHYGRFLTTSRWTANWCREDNMTFCVSQQMGRSNLQVKDHAEVGSMAAAQQFFQHPHGCAPWIVNRFNTEFYCTVLRHLKENMLHKKLKLRCNDIQVLQLRFEIVHIVLIMHWILSHTTMVALHPYHSPDWLPQKEIKVIQTEGSTFWLSGGDLVHVADCACRTWLSESIPILVQKSTSMGTQANINQMQFFFPALL